MLCKCIQDIVTKINVKPTNAEAGNTVSEEMCTAGNEIINSFDGDSTDDPMKQRLKDVVEQIQEGSDCLFKIVLIQYELHR